jgi:uncharacterized GH25 family protein
MKLAVILMTCLLSPGIIIFAPAQGAQADDNQTPSQAPEESNPKGKSPAQATVRLKIVVTGNNGNPVQNASVYVRYKLPDGLFHKDKMAELDLKTASDGSVKVPPVPQGKVLIQVIAPGWHTYGKWYDFDKDEDSVEIKLAPPTHWY